MKAMPLSVDHFQQAARALGCEVAAIRTVVDVESSDFGGHLPDGRPVILFEAHKFSAFTSHRYDRSHPEISSPRWDRSLYCRGPWPHRGYCEHERLSLATSLDREAGLKSASYGLFQIMGFNWRVCGYDSLQDFINAMWGSEAEHLEAFVGYVQHHGLGIHLAQQNWDAFAYEYNGPSYKTNDYQVRMRRAYERFTQRDSECSEDDSRLAGVA